jgi:hypothetical protein
VQGVVVAVSRSAEHAVGKANAPAIRLLAGQGVEGDAHRGALVQHRSRVARDPRAPNLRQVHLLHAELPEELGARGFALAPGALGENVTTRGLELLALPSGARLPRRRGPDRAHRPAQPVRAARRASAGPDGGHARPRPTESWCARPA